MVRIFLRVFIVLFVVSALFQVALAWDTLVRLGWPWRTILGKLPIAAGVALIAAGAVMIFQSPRADDDDDD